MRNGIVIATQRKDLQLSIASCTIAAASLLPEYLLCTNSNTLSIANNSTSPLIKTYNWELVNSKGITVYKDANPGLTYNFKDTGLYKIKLAINKDLECSDSMESVARVYPGMVSDFDFSGICFKKPTQFISKSKTVYGEIDFLKWNFGEGTANDNEIGLPGPSYQYASLGNKNPQLVVNTTTGCRDTVSKIISIIEKPLLKLGFRDTLVCVNDNLNLLAEGKGNFSWSPAVTLTNSKTATPSALPQKNTTYFVTLDDNGCINQDSLRVSVVDKVLLRAMNDTIICQGDTIQLNLVSDALSYSWSAAGNPMTNLPNPIISVSNNTTYKITARIGGCIASDEVHVNAIPYPKASAGTDTVICFDNGVQLNGWTTATAFRWSPSSSLSGINILSPVAKPLNTTSYIIEAFDNKGCPKPGRDTVLVTVLPPIIPFAGRDTSAVMGQPLQLNATGGVAYRWSPSFALSANNISNPVATFTPGTDDMNYKVEVFNVAGCMEAANVKVKIFSTAPSVFVPTAFTPNGDGKNDKVAPLAVGMKYIEAFQIFNRWGQLVYSSPDPGKGWDGTVGGTIQKTETFIWVVKAVDYNGKAYFKKGPVTLIH
jgi:gliding motility-associated-like protein